ncbi:MAG: cellulase family glycosylhydrolase [Polyangiaceae bacterium]
MLAALLSAACARSTHQARSAASPPLAEPAPAPDPLLDVEPTDVPSAVFIDDGKPFCFAGTNNYYLNFKSQEMVDDVLEQSRAMGLQVVRTWGFIDRGSLDGSVPSVDGEGHKDQVYFQYWDSRANAPAYNDGADGLVRLDYLLAKARAEGLRVLLVLTNNWKDFGGMNQYLEWFDLAHHHQFYTDVRARQAYKDWVSHLVHRVNTITKVAYKDDPTIFAWELANEPRCRNYGPYDRAQDCQSTMLTSWAGEMSAYIKSIDPNHLVSVGDEGFFARADGLVGSGWQYTGADGVDHEALLALPAVDFGTFHLYPDSWKVDTAWGNQWIVDHIAAAQAANKPTILEEYGVEVERDARNQVTGGFERRRSAYINWNELMLQRGGSASMFWILVGKEPGSELGVYKDYDHFSVYNQPGDESAKLLIESARRFQATGARACELATKAGASAKSSPFVSTWAPPKALAMREPEPALLAQTWLR